MSTVPFEAKMSQLDAVLNLLNKQFKIFIHQLTYLQVQGQVHSVRV